MSSWTTVTSWRVTDLRILGRAFRASLKGYRKRRMEYAGKDVEALLGGYPPNAKEAWRRMKGWYKAAVNRAPPPARATLERITAERVELYHQVPSPGDNIPVTVNPSKIDDSVPTENEIAEAVKKLRRNRSGWPSRIRAEHLKWWLVASKRGELAKEKGEEKTEAEEEGGELWGKVVEITQTESREVNWWRKPRGRPWLSLSSMTTYSTPSTRPIFYNVYINIITRESLRNGGREYERYCGYWAEPSGQA